MAFTALDANVRTTSKLACFGQNGIKAVGRYYTKNASNPKLLSASEAKALSQAGLLIWAVYQDRQNQVADFSQAKGLAAGNKAIEHARDVIEQPKGTAIYFAVDFDATSAQYNAAIKPYFEGVAQALTAAGNPYVAGVYGSGMVCQRLLDAGLVKFTWVSMSSGFTGTAAFLATNRWNIRQHLDTDFCGLNIDPDTINPLLADFGAFAVGVPAIVVQPPVAPQPQPGAGGNGALPVWMSLEGIPTVAEIETALAKGTRHFDIRYGQFDKLGEEGDTAEEVATARTAIAHIKARGGRVTLYHEGAGGGEVFGESKFDLTQTSMRKALRNDLRELASAGADFIHIDNVHDLTAPDDLRAVLDLSVDLGVQPIVKNNPQGWAALLEGGAGNRLRPPYAVIENLIGHHLHGDAEGNSYVTATRKLAERFSIPVYAVDFKIAVESADNVERQRAETFLHDNASWLRGVYLMERELPKQGGGGFDCRPGNCVFLANGHHAGPLPAPAPAPLAGGNVAAPAIVNAVAGGQDFVAFMRSQGLQFFQPYEFIVKGSQHSNPNSAAFGLNTDPPRELWPNIVPTARVLDELRRRVGAPIAILSAYRSPAYNRAIGGAGASMHMQFKAIDFVVRSHSSPLDWARALREMRSSGLFSGGIGTYSGFVHVDTRGENADWPGG